MSIPRRLTAEALGTGFLLIAVVGSGPAFGRPWLYRSGNRRGSGRGHYVPLAAAERMHRRRRSKTDG
jgi:hypothetical protein